ncbi:AMP-binding protein, partial [Salmonella enterica subsp. enterica serovar Virchow]|nr:AMP-binding protein [Salmonella enterica subsp. enterica serovar Virchow]
MDHSLKPVEGASHVVGERAPPLLNLTIPQLLARAVAANGPADCAIFVEQNKRFTWRAFSETVDQFAAGLLALGLRKGDRIGIWSPNRWEWLVTQFATARIGLILVNINPAYRLAELEYALNKVACRALVTASKFKTSDYLGMLQTLAPELAHCEAGQLNAEKLPHLDIVIRMGEETSPGMFNFGDVQSLAQAAQLDQLDALSAELAPDDAINIQFTSGTTGAPKGATLTHRNIVNNADQVTSCMNFSADDRLCIPVPFYHCFGMVMGTLGCVSKGATMVFPGEGFDPDATLRAATGERCTALYGVPTMFVAMLDHPEFSSFDFSHLRTGIMAGAPCPIEVMKKVNALMNMREVTIAYGMTETSPVSFQTAVDDPLEKRVASVGRVRPHLEVKMIDEHGATVPVGKPGELCTRGYSVMKGYWGDEARTREAIDADGWMHTGDLATLDEDGYCNIVGRVKDLVIRGGENVYPREVEEYLYRNEKIAQVQVFGVPDEKYGEEIACWIVVKSGETLSEDDVKDFCRGQIAHYKIPRYVRFKPEIPMTVTGKAQKFV